MLSSKLFRRSAALLLVLCAALMLIPLPVLAEDDVLPQEESTQSAIAVSVVHYSAYSGSSSIGYLEDGTRLTVLGEKGDFLKIDCYDMNGYIAKSQVRQDADEEYYVNCQTGSRETRGMTAYSAQDVLRLRGSLCATAMKYRGVPYVLGGSSPWGFDCCGLTQYVYAQEGIPLERNQNEQLHDGIIVAKEDMQPGDLVFLENTNGYGVIASHVGMYIGNGKMIHAGNSGVAVVDLDNAYYASHYLCARRVVLTDLSQSAVPAPLGLSQSINSSYWREGSQPSVLGTSFFGEILYW